MKTFEEFKSLIEKSEESANFSFQPEQVEQFYKEQCLQQIGVDLDTVLGFFMKNHQDMTTEQLYDWHLAIRRFFGIEVKSNGEISSKGNDFDIDKKELSRTEKIFQAEESLKKAGLIL